MTDGVEQNKAIAFIRSRLTAVLGAGRDATKAVLSLGPLVAVASDLLPTALPEPPLPEVSGRVVSAADAAGVIEFIASMSALAIGAMSATRSGATTAPSSTPLLSGATIDTAAFLERAGAVRALAAALWRLDGSIPRDATLEGPLTYCFAEDGAMPTVGAAPSKSISPASRLHSANVRITLKALAVAGPDIAIDGAFAALWSVQPAPAEDCPPKGRLLPVGYKVDRAPAHVAALAPVPFPTALSLVLDGCIALHCDADAPDTSLSLGVATSLIVELCQRSVLACRLVQHWILALIKEPVALLAEATSSLPTSPHIREGIDRCVALAAQLLSQFGFEFPWARVANFATSAAASKWPLQRSMLLDLVERVSCLTFDERLRATVAASIAAASPPSFVSLAALRTSTPSIDDHRCIFELPPAFENAAGEYRRLLGSVCGIVPETQRGPAAPTAAVAAGPIPAMAIKRLLLSHRTASLSTRTAGRFIPAPARQLEAADERLACMLYFVATPPIRSARVASARSLIATLGEDADALQRDDLWITTAHELLQQLRRLEASDAQPNGAISVGVRWLWDAIVVLADEHFLRARALGSFFALDLLSPILGTLQLRTCVTEACDLYLNRLLRARVAASTPAEASATRLKFATLEASAFFDALTAALGPAVVESLKLLIANKSVVQAVSTLATASAVGRKALSGLLRFSDVFSDDASLGLSQVEALVKELGDPAWAREVLLLWTHRDVSNVPVPHDASALLVVAPVHTGLALRRDAEEAVAAANVEMVSAR